MDRVSEPTPVSSPTSSPVTTAGRIIGLVVAAVFLVCIVIAAVTMPEGITGSSDEGVAALPVWAILLPNAVGIALALALPAGRRRLLPVREVDRPRLRTSVWVLLAIAAAFPLLTALPGVSGSILYVAAKVVLLIIGGAIVVAHWRPVVAFDQPRGAWSGWMPVVVIVAWLALTFLVPWVPRHDFSGLDPIELAVVALITALTAGVGEELFYRRWLQTRLEAVLGGWPGILVASLVFAFMHLGSHGTGDLGRDVVSVVVSQGTAGLLLGVVWWRYRALWAIVAIHVLMNGWPVLAWFAPR